MKVHLSGKEINASFPDKKIPELRGTERRLLPKAQDAVSRSDAGRKVPLQNAGTVHQTQKTLSAAERLSGLMASLKLPEDSLSRSVISFARFFSLPLEPELLAGLRRAALGRRGFLREAAVLAAAAAADKGAELSARALSDYAAAIEGFPDPDSRDGSPEDDLSGGNGDAGGGSGTNTETGNSDGSSGSGRSGGKNGNREKNRNPAKALDGLLRRSVGAVLEKKPWLDLLNRIPGKSGRRWITVPFSFCREGIEWTVIVRLLLNNPAVKKQFTGIPGFPERLSMDIKVRPAECPAAGPDGEPLGWSRRWLVNVENRRPERTGPDAPDIRVELSLLDSAVYGDTSGKGASGGASRGKGASGGASRGKGASVSLAEQKRLAKELAGALGIPAVRFREGALPFDGSREDLLRPIDEAV